MRALGRTQNSGKAAFSRHRFWEEASLKARKLLVSCCRAPPASWGLAVKCSASEQTDRSGCAFLSPVFTGMRGEGLSVLSMLEGPGPEGPAPRTLHGLPLELPPRPGGPTNVHVLHAPDLQS